MMKSNIFNNHALLSDGPVQIAGAGPSGLATAITLAREGVAVEVHEAQKEVGFRFQGDLQGLENWTTKQDVLQGMHEHGLNTDFKKIACRDGTVFDSEDNAYTIASPEVLFYMVERGPGSESLDTALLNQARELGVEVVFNSRLKHINDAGVLAIGPKAADAIAVGYHFETDRDDSFWVICDDNLAPKGYAYVLIMNGHGTLKSCMFSGFKQEQVYVERTVEAFEKLINLEMINPIAHGGVGNFNLPSSALHGGHPIAGEQAGFQDTLWGFGMRQAMTSGILAAESLLKGEDYDNLWQRSFSAQIETSIVNRALFSLLGNRGYRIFLQLVSKSSDPRAILTKHYGPLWYKKILLPWARWRYKSQRKDKSCDHVNCSCVWCRCGSQI